MRRNYTSEEILVDKLLIDDTESFEELHHRYCIPLYKDDLKWRNQPEEYACFPKEQQTFLL